MINGPGGVKLIPLTAQREKRAGSLAVGGREEDVQLLLQGHGTPPKDQKRKGSSGSCAEKGDRVFLGSPTPPVSQGSCQGPWASHSWQKHRLLETACSFPGQLGSEERLSCRMGHPSSGKHHLHSLSLLFCYLLYNHLIRPAAAFLFARNGLKIYFSQQFRIMFLWGLFLTSFPSYNNLLSLGVCFHPVILHRSHSLMMFKLTWTQLKVNLFFNFIPLYVF